MGFMKLKKNTPSSMVPDNLRRCAHAEDSRSGVHNNKFSTRSIAKKTLDAFQRGGERMRYGVHKLSQRARKVYSIITEPTAVKHEKQNGSNNVDLPTPIYNTPQQRFSRSTNQRPILTPRPYKELALSGILYSQVKARADDMFSPAEPPKTLKGPSKSEETRQLGVAASPNQCSGSLRGTLSSSKDGITIPHTMETLSEEIMAQTQKVDMSHNGNKGVNQVMNGNFSEVDASRQRIPLSRGSTHCQSPPVRFGDINPLRTSTASSAASSISDEWIHGHPEFDACYWGRLRDIPHKSIQTLISRVMNDSSDCEVIGCDWGTFNIVYTMQLSSGIRVCLKVPTVGQEGRWGSNSAQALRSEALTMQYIRTHSSFPVPKVHGFDTTFANEIQAPFILIGFILGSSVEDTFNKWVEEGVYEQKSANLLESLANCMANLGELRFSKIGMLEFLDPSGEPEVVALKDWYLLHHGNTKSLDPKDVNIKRGWQTFGPYGTSKELFSARFRILNKQVWTDEYEGMYEILELCFSCLPASSDGSTTGAESFGICHPDLAFQNIFCDDEGNITGIIDWDGVYVGPLYMGCYSFPLWLREDWQRDYIWPYGDPFLSPDELAESRAVYSSAMRKFMSTHDSWLYPDKSLYLMALYDILAVPGGKHACRSYMRKLFQLVLPTVDPESFFSRLANVEGDETDHGWIVTNYVDAKEYLVERITRLYQCNQKSSASTPGLIQGELGRKPLANMATPTPYYAPPRSCRDPAHNNRSAHDDRSSRSGHMIGHEATTHSPSLAIKLKEKHQDGLVVKDDQDDQDSSKHDEENSEDSWVSSDMEPSVGQEDLDAEYNARCSAELADSPQLGAKGRSPTHSPPKLGVMRSDYMNPSAWLGSKS